MRPKCARPRVYARKSSASQIPAPPCTEDAKIIRLVWRHYTTCLGLSRNAPETIHPVIRRDGGNGKNLDASVRSLSIGREGNVAAFDETFLDRRTVETQVEINKTIEFRDGTVVQSEGERRIAEWLTAHGIACRYDVKRRQPPPSA